MPTAQKISRIYENLYQYVPQTDGSNIVTLIDNSFLVSRDLPSKADPDTWCGSFVNVLRCKATIISLPEMPIPDFKLEDSDTDKLNKTNQIVWSSIAYRLVLYKSLGASPSPWIEIAFYNFTRNTGSPYKIYNLFDALTTDIADVLQQNGRIGIAFQDIGQGLPKSQDLITFRAAWTREYKWINTYDISISQPVVVQTATVQQVVQKNDSYTLRVGNTSQVLLNANGNRLSGQIKNNSNNIVYYGLDITPTTTSNSGAAAANATVPLPAGFKGAVNVISTTAGATNVVVGSEVYNVAAS